MSKNLDVYLSYSSPFAYLAQTQIRALAERTQCQINYYVIDLRNLWEITGNPGPTNVPAKLKYLGKDIGDWCKHYGVPLNLPSRLPIDSRPASGASIGAQKAGKLPEFVDRVMYAYFVEDQDIAAPQVLSQLAAEIGLDGHTIAAVATDPIILKEVDKLTEEAASRGVFGVPTFFIGNDMYWGSDRLMFVEAALKS
ncbi:MAG TPA: 2-hydroxychromene-2-carboxylate isomerase [Oculatellaceae cyanobacterium]|jgi:2-hydroxychromene-2-carboxylate isomerase